MEKEAELPSGIETFTAYFLAIFFPITGSYIVMRIAEMFLFPGKGV